MCYVLLLMKDEIMKRIIDDNFVNYW